MKAKTRGQVVIELVIASTVSFVFIVASVRLWVYFVRTLVERQQAYQASRLEAGRNTKPGCQNYYQYGRPSVFGAFNVPAGKSLPCTAGPTSDIAGLPQ